MFKGLDDFSKTLAGQAHGENLLTNTPASQRRQHVGKRRVSLAVIPGTMQKRVMTMAFIREQTGATILALRQRTGKLIVAPTPETVIQARDMIVALRTRHQLTRLRAIATT
jgi:uncharacterized protein with PhoU and TrkA domain